MFVASRFLLLPLFYQLNESVLLMNAYLAQRLATSLYLQTNGLKLHILHYENKDAPNILMLHGWMDCALSFQFCIDAMQNQWNIYSLDWRGFGLSQWQTAGYYDRMMMVSDLKNVVDYLSPHAPMHICGHSMGGMLAALYAGLYPQRVKSLVLAEGFGLPDMPMSTALDKMTQFMDANSLDVQHRARVIHDLTSVIKKLAQKNPLMQPEHIAFMAEALTQAQDDCFIYKADPKHHLSQPYWYHEPLLASMWSRIEAPVLWIEGDDVAHNYYLNLMREHLPERKKHFKTLTADVRIPNAGHLMQWEAPKAFAQAIEAFWLQQDTKAQSMLG